MDLRHEPEFDKVAPLLNMWFTDMLGDNGAAGILVSHNTAVDIQFLLCEYIRANLRLPTQITLGLDTLGTLRRFSSLSYRKASHEEWCAVYGRDSLTKTGQLSMGIKYCASYALGKRVPPETFKEVCGEHHDADADTRAVAVTLFDGQVFGNKGLHHCVFKSNKRCCFPLKDEWIKMKQKMSEPPMQINPLPAGWMPAPSEDPAEPLASSSRQLPKEIPVEIKQKTFIPPRGQRGEGQPSSALRRHLGVGSTRSGTKLSVASMLLHLFLFFFSMSTLADISKFTNAKALEVVSKVRYTRSDGSIHYKVNE